MKPFYHLSFLFSSQASASSKEPKDAVWRVHLRFKFIEYEVNLSNLLIVDQIKKRENFCFEGIGSGFFISPYHLITAFHVVGAVTKDMDILLTQHKNGKTLQKKPVRILKLSSVDDLALLEVKHPSSKVRNYLPIKYPSTHLKRGETVQVMGYPGGVHFSAIPMNYNNFLAMINFNQFVTKESLEDLGGISGGPVLNQNSEVVGVVANGGKNSQSSITLETVDHFIKRKANCRYLPVKKCLEQEWKILKNKVSEGDSVASFRMDSFNKLLPIKQKREKALKKVLAHNKSLEDIVPRLVYITQKKNESFKKYKKDHKKHLNNEGKNDEYLKAKSEYNKIDDEYWKIRKKLDKIQSSFQLAMKRYCDIKLF